ncbi:hypothetical protein FEV13_00700 (plasmid) [Stutzerimonas degradans]|nr:hypothetical protein FEV13_00700 [Stutzerimonas degradans]
MNTATILDQNPTLAQINERLKSVSLPIIPRDKVQAVLAHAERTKLINALNRIDNPEDFAYVTSSLTAAQIMAAGEPEEDAGQYGEHGQANDDDQNRTQRDENNLLSERAKFHVYGGKAALCFEVDTTRGGVPTIALDAASSSAPRAYNWSQKIRIQLTRAELPVVAAVLLGARESCEFSAHGADKTKGFSMERQGNRIFTKVYEKNRGARAVPIEAADAFYVATLFLLQIRKISPWLDASSTIALVRSTMYQAPRK